MLGKEMLTTFLEGTVDQKKARKGQAEDGGCHLERRNTG